MSWSAHRATTAGLLVLALLAVLAILGAPALAAPPGNGVTADFDGDGFADLAVGKPGEDAGAMPDAGAVNVTYGSPSGVDPHRTQLWTQDTLAIVGDTAEAGDAFGTALAAGDFNGDGYADLAVGAPKEGVDVFGGVALEAGAIDVIYGSPAGLTAANATFLHQDSNVRSTGIADRAEDLDQFGLTLVAANFGNGPQADLAVGVPFEEVDGKSEAGAWNVLYGGPNGFGDSFGPSPQLWTQDSPGIADSVETSDRAGLALAAGDFGRSGEADLAVGVPFEQSVNGIADAGAAHVLYGSPNGLTAAGSQLWHQDVGGVADAVEAFDFFGRALAGGNVGKGGRADLALGVPGEDRGASFDAGAVTVLYGTANGLTATGSQLWHQDSGGVPDAVEPADELGAALAVGDLGRGGEGDLAIGAPGEDVGSTADAGAVNVLYGTASGLAATGAQLWHQNSAGVASSAEAGDAFGSALGAWNFGGSARADLAVGVPLEDVGAVTDGGAVHVLPGGASGLTAAGSAFLTEETLGFASQPGDEFGRALVP
jgi:hypothetical protein